jgi:pimeloyl-ACP methyl ester carboxylesterase
MMPRKFLRSVLLAIAVSSFISISFRGSELELQENPARLVDADVPARSNYTVVNGIRIHYLEWGRSGPAIVLIHGLYDNAGVWQSLAPRLAADCHILAPDRRGAGGSDTPKKGYDSQTQVSDLIALIESQKLGPVTLVGHSAGAEIALRIAAQRSEIVRSVVMIDGGFWPSKNVAPATSPAAPCSDPDECARWLTLENSSREYHPEALYPHVVSPVLLVVARQTQPGGGLLTEYQKRGINYFEQIKKAEQHAKEVAESKLHHGKMTIIKNTSHWIQKDQPSVLAEAIKNFLSGIR